MSLVYGEQDHFPMFSDTDALANIVEQIRLIGGVWLGSVCHSVYTILMHIFSLKPSALSSNLRVSNNKFSNMVKPVLSDHPLR